MSSPATFNQLLQAFAARPSVRTLESALQRVMQDLVNAGFSHLPLPGHGQTLERWRALALVGGTDLALAKLYEGHTDALAIMAELEPRTPPAAGSWGVWAAESSHARIRIIDRQGQGVYLRGRKAWCSGALQLDWALLTAWDEQQRSQLVAVELKQSSIRMIDDAWQAVGMSSTASIDVEFEDTFARCVGSPGAYLERPGFWQGGGGIAACWYGAACSIAGLLHMHCIERPHDAHALAHLGTVDTALSGAATGLRATARWIDDHPHDTAELPVRRLRAQIEAAAGLVLDHVGRALGATPFCHDNHFARLAADLPVFLRQSHAERDLAALGQQVALHPVEEWSL